jgi:C-terminal processing protease CtpA/Prc
MSQHTLKLSSYLLTSRRTFSAAEEFTYNLQKLNRATIIGETTGGGAHPGRMHQLNEHFDVFISRGRAINPITNGNWEGTGIKPDIETTKEDALEVAYVEALETVVRNSSSRQIVEEAKKALLAAKDGI